MKVGVRIYRGSWKVPLCTVRFSADVRGTVVSWLSTVIWGGGGGRSAYSRLGIRAFEAIECGPSGWGPQMGLDAPAPCNSGGGGGVSLVFFSQECGKGPRWVLLHDCSANRTQANNYYSRVRQVLTERNLNKYGQDHVFQNRPLAMSGQDQRGNIIKP